ncbi:MAG: hypothetical protein JNK72_11530 [Myxococcales bacterium]|nr:hypothetical protein [Myxococcales bacterium]
MSTQGETSSARTFHLASRDLVVAIAAREDFPTFLDAFAKQRGALYAAPSAEIDEASYWPGVARSLASIAPPETMPMSGLIASGITLEGGARGLRSLFTSKVSKSEHKRVINVASLAARVMEVVAGADDALSDDERRGIAMAMASFGLNDEELEQVKAPSKLKPEQLEIFGELDAKVRRELLRGAWQLCLRGTPTAAELEVVAAVGVKLEIAAESDTLKLAVTELLTRAGQTAALAVELARAAGADLEASLRTAALERLIQAVAPPSRAVELRARVDEGRQASFDNLGLTTRAQRLQAVALAWATLAGTDPRYSVGLHLRGELSAAATEAGAAYEVAEALDTVDRYLHQRLREVSTAPSAVRA